MIGAATASISVLQGTLSGATLKISAGLVHVCLIQTLVAEINITELIGIKCRLPYFEEDCDNTVRTARGGQQMICRNGSDNQSENNILRCRDS